MGPYGSYNPDASRGGPGGRGGNVIGGGYGGGIGSLVGGGTTGPGPAGCQGARQAPGYIDYADGVVTFGDGTTNRQVVETLRQMGLISE